MTNTKYRDFCKKYNEKLKNDKDIKKNKLSALTNNGNLFGGI